MPSGLMVGALPSAPVETLASPVASERETRPRILDPDDPALMPDSCMEVSPLTSDPEHTPPPCSTPPADVPPPPPGPEGSAPVQYQAPHQITKALFAPEQQVQPPVSQVQVQVQLAGSSVSSPPPLRASVSVPQQQPRPTAAGLSDGGDESAVQQHKHSKPQPPSWF